MELGRDPPRSLDGPGAGRDQQAEAHLLNSTGAIRLLGRSSTSLVHARTMVDALNDDGPRLVSENREEAVITDSELVIVRGGEASEKSVGVSGRLLKLGDNSSSDRGIQALQVPDRPLGPSDRPPRQRPNRFLHRPSPTTRHPFNYSP